MSKSYDYSDHWLPPLVESYMERGWTHRKDWIGLLTRLTFPLWIVPWLASCIAGLVLFVVVSCVLIAAEWIWTGDFF